MSFADDKTSVPWREFKNNQSSNDSLTPLLQANGIIGL